MSTRFTERAQRVILIAQEEAKRLHHDCVEPLHILSAVVALGEGVACQILAAAGLSHRRLRDELRKTMAEGSRPAPMGEVPFTPQSKKVLEHAVEEARELGHSFVGTEHLLLGLFHAETSAQALQRCGFALEAVRAETLRILGTGRPPIEGEPVEAQLEKLERSLLEPQTRKSASALAALLADDFREFAGDGRIYDKAQIIAALQAAPAARSFLRDFKAVRLAPDIALATFCYSRESTPDRPVADSLRSSVWRRMDGRWQMVFHQGTLCARPQMPE